MLSICTRHFCAHTIWIPKNNKHIVNTSVYIIFFKLNRIKRTTHNHTNYYFHNFSKHYKRCTHTETLPPLHLNSAQPFSAI